MNALFRLHIRLQCDDSAIFPLPGDLTTSNRLFIITLIDPVSRMLLVLQRREGEKEQIESDSRKTGKRLAASVACVRKTTLVDVRCDWVVVLPSKTIVHHTSDGYDRITVTQSHRISLSLSLPWTCDLLPIGCSIEVEASHVRIAIE